MNRKPLKIGRSPRFLPPVLREMGFKGKTLQYLEQSIAHWLTSAGALVFMIPSIAGGGLVFFHERYQNRPTVESALYLGNEDGAPWSHCQVRTLPCGSNGRPGCAQHPLASCTSRRHS